MSLGLSASDTPKGNMSFQKHVPSGDVPSMNLKSLSFSTKSNERLQLAAQQRNLIEADVDVDLREVYFLIMHFLSAGPCHRTYVQFWNELLEHQLLPRRYHPWYSRSGMPSGDENDDGMSLPLSYNKLAERYPHIDRDHLVKLLKQLILSTAVPSKDMVGRELNAAAVPTLLGTGSFSLLSGDQSKRNTEVQKPSAYMRWPHMLADQVRGLSLREIGGGFSRHHRAPSVRAASYAIAKPSTMVQKMQNIKKVRGHRNAVYCAIFDRSGRYVITGSDDRLVKIWSMETAYCLASCRGHEGDITDLAVNFNNTLVASASNDFIIRVWRLPDGLPISVLRGHIGAVTAIAFSPRPSSVYQLLSSSDDGTCRIWDARYSQLSPRIYVPKPPDYVAGKSSILVSSIAQQNNQIFCCAFNASGTVFVTGSSDTLARVWNACKSTTDDIDKPYHEMDVLAGHENDVNYVQFSGCAVASRASTSDASKEDGIPKFKSTWFNHDNIVTCSRDGSAIIWIPRSRRSHGKVGRWTRAYHLRVPPPPMPPQPPRGGPRQRMLPTPRGVNMIVWSLDNRFVLAAIMDCRICVWNAADGSLVHSLTGHTESTYVLDVHPFNPRIAMSAGYDGKTIVWDIWEGTPVRIYEIGRFRLVDGKFSPDGTSIILSDDVGQLYILNTGQGESQQDAKYDQFFLGDYRPLIQDTHGNALDQETQLAPYRRNIQDFLCDAGMIPYEEPYQSMFQRRRLGALGFDWRPSSIRFAIGPDITLDQDYQMLPIADLDILIEPLPEFVDAMEWEPENEVQSDDTDSEYNVTEDYSSGGELGGTRGSNSSDDPEDNADDSEVENSVKDGLRRSKRKKQKVDHVTSSGRRIKRKNLDHCENGGFRNHKTRKLKSGHKASRKKSSLLKSSRPRRAAARNALNLFSQITGTSTGAEDEYVSAGESSESESTLQDLNFESEESDAVLQNERRERSKGKEVSLDESMEIAKPPEHTALQRKRLVLKLPNRDLTKHVPVEERTLKFHNQPKLVFTCPTDGQDPVHGNSEYEDTIEKVQLKDEHNPNLLEGCKDGKIKWGGVKLRTSKRTRIAESSSSGLLAGSSSRLDGHIQSEDGNQILENSCINISPCSDLQNQDDKVDEVVLVGPRNSKDQCEDYENSPSFHKAEGDRALSSIQSDNGTENACDIKVNHIPIVTKLRIRSKIFPRNTENSTRIVIKSSTEDVRLDTSSEISPDAVDILTSDKSGPLCIEGRSLSNGVQRSMPELDAVADRETKSNVQLLEHSDDRMYNAVYRRAKSSTARSNNPEANVGDMVATTSYSGKHRNLNEGTVSGMDGIHRMRHMGHRSTAHSNGNNINLRVSHDGSMDMLTSPGSSFTNRSSDLPCEEWGPSSRVTVGARSTRNRRGNYFTADASPPDRKKIHQSGRKSWLMLSTHDEGFRYIPQYGDEVVYLRQGHWEFINYRNSRERGPWDTIKGPIRAVEYCKVEDLEYSTSSGSGESCCKMTLKFVDPSSSVCGKSFKLALPEVTNFPDFLVERSRYDMAIQRNWTCRDKCQVWWKNDGEEDGSWWDGRILAVKPKSDDYPDSPWDSFIVRYKSDPTELHQHSPWELYDADMQWEQPHIDDEFRDKLLHAFFKLEQSGNKPQDYFGVQKLKQVSQKLNFVNRFPVPLSLDVIQSRLENNYYRSLEAMEHDFSVMLANAESYFGRNTEILTKLKRLSEWFTRTISSL